MKSFKILIAATLLAGVLTGCTKEVFTGIDSSKAGVTDFTYDDINSSATSAAFYWDAAAALKAGATSFSVQLAQKEDFSDVDMYNASVGKTIQAGDAMNDAVTFTGLKEYATYYARVRANYPRSIYSDWAVLKMDGQLACVSVGHGIVSMSFTAPSKIDATAAVYSKINAKWPVIGLADGYVPEWKKSSGTEWTVLSPTAKVECEITGTEPLTSYDVRVRAYRNVDGVPEYTDYVSTSVTTPAKPAFEPQISTAEQLTTFLNEIAATASASDTYTLESDIDLAGAVFAAPVEGFAGVLDGKGHTIKNAEFPTGAFARVTGTVKNIKFSNIKLTTGLITILDTGATLSGVSLDAGCSVNYAEPATAINLGDLVCENYGTIENCSNASTLKLEFAAAPKQPINIGGIAGFSNGKVKGCTNTGARSISIAAPASGTFHCFGGVVGQYAVQPEAIGVENCTNEGAISVEYGTAVYFFTGGVVGGSPADKSTPGNYGIIAGCINKGTVSMHYISGGSGAYPNIGGVVGYTEGYLKDCENFGAISLLCDSEANTWTCPRIAGVGGTVTCGANGCKNHGTLSSTALFAGGTAGNKGAGNIASGCWGGVIASAGPYESDGTVVFEKCVNDANLDFVQGTITETPNSYYGAVFGYVTGKIDDCHNTGDITVTTPTAIARLGGITGGCKYTITNSDNSGKVTLNNTCVKATNWRGFVGGIIGDYSAAGDVTMTKCTNSGAVTFKSTATTTASTISCIGGLVGCKKAGTTVTFTDCTNTGAVTAESGSSATTDNFIGGDYNS